MKFGRYIKDCSAELKKVIWPNKSDVVYYIRVVLAMTVISAAILFVVDLLSMRAISFLF